MVSINDMMWFKTCYLLIYLFTLRRDIATWFHDSRHDREMTVAGESVQTASRRRDLSVGPSARPGRSNPHRSSTSLLLFIIWRRATSMQLSPAARHAHHCQSRRPRDGPFCRLPACMVARNINDPAAPKLRSVPRHYTGVDFWRLAGVYVTGPTT